MASSRKSVPKPASTIEYAYVIRPRDDSYIVYGCNRRGWFMQRPIGFFREELGQVYAPECLRELSVLAYPIVLSLLLLS